MTQIDKEEEKDRVPQNDEVEAVVETAVIDNRSPDDIEADEIERFFGPVDKKQEDVEQVYVYIEEPA
jgi:hypothetical protein